MNINRFQRPCRCDLCWNDPISEFPLERSANRSGAERWTAVNTAIQTFRLRPVVLSGGNDTWSIAEAAAAIYYSPDSLLGISACYLYNAAESQMTSKSPL